ncbi:hypothetical protein GR248_24265 [Rhizobium leguminosarum]|uniref:metallophosphoesterase n=1 Tax=Rhizobium leguminosarum TaxID=384 RepID=UPI0013CB82D5|nr:hypothetical protein [Rhizobium leguminosarum]
MKMGTVRVGPADWELTGTSLGSFAFGLDGAISATVPTGDSFAHVGQLFAAGSIEAIELDGQTPADLPATIDFKPEKGLAVACLKKVLRAFVVLAVAGASSHLLGGAIGSSVAQEPAKAQPIGILLAAGDITICDSNREDDMTAGLIQSVIAEYKDTGIPVRILPLGDLAYPNGSTGSFNCYDDYWGQKDWIRLTLPVIGNHDRQTGNGKPFYEFFRDRGNLLLDEHGAGAGYYAINLPDEKYGPWKLIALDYLQTDAKGNQIEWLNKLLADATTPCIVAFTHVHPFSAGRHGHCKQKHGKLSCYSNDSDAKQGQDSVAKANSKIFEKLYSEKATLFLAGHDHNFEQQPRKNGKGEIDKDRGVRSFVVGTGGANLTKVDYDDNKNNGIDIYKSFGVLKIDLYPGRYEWQFKTKHGVNLTSGMDTCNRL